ncbi:DUF2491 family protein [Roseomonas sp. SSH11]|uniref:DUF2491 family protein n=1 Tax=Pararoseomonas baculiformis TaxID=2820812 RepID=A0ABS4AH74_9PROT|nr:DUF2491 family protein [Pararoseomonas baculiformis]MBP0445569.1 DUF2491 family protein [Pararoseomonas baculiformis]
MRGPSTRLLALLLLAVPVTPTLVLPGLALVSAEAEARPRARSSGGYSRPSSGGRTPSFSGGGYSRAPSSGGYARPRSSGGGFSIPSTGGSAADRDYGRSQAGDALRRMREAEAAAQRRAQPAPAPSGGGFSFPAPRSRTPSGGGWSGGGWSGPSSGGWYRDRGWSVPGSVLSGPRSFGIWDAAFLWFLFSNLSRPGHADFFRNHQDDPGYRSWRQEAEQRAQGDAEIRRQLDELDRRLAGSEGQPRDPNYLPPGIPPEVATGREAPPPEDRRTPSTADQDGESGGLLGSMGGLLLVGGGVAAFLALRRARNRAGTGGTGMTTGDTLRSAGGMLRHKMSGEGYAPSRFRLGTTLTIDPTPFLLAAGSTHVTAPPGAGGRVSVTAIGRIGGGGPGSMLRLYLPEGGAMLQLHLDAQGEASECRYFSLLDEIAPADEGEWGAWLDPAEGMIGWPEFQTRDGKLYGRVWAPGSSRVPPRLLEEEVETPQGRRIVRSQAMLYGASTGAAAPAPQTEYILVSAVEDGTQAWVEVRAGLDVNPASLSPT